MDQKQLQQIFLDTDFVHWSGTPEELKVAEYLKAKCEGLGVPAHLEGFRVASADIESAQVLADGKEIPCKGFFGCGSGTVEGELYYMTATDPVSIAGAKDKIVTARGTEEIAEKLGCPVYMYPEFGHSAYEEAKDFNTRVLDFFRAQR